MTDSLVIIGRRWFQRGPGNTYHTAEIIMDGVTKFKTEKEYGYGEQYVETAFRELESKGLIAPRVEHSNGSHEAYWQWAERNKVALVYRSIDVSRERDL
jgi:hypothetical protein